MDFCGDLQNPYGFMWISVGIYNILMDFCGFLWGSMKSLWIYVDFCGDL